MLKKFVNNNLVRFGIRICTLRKTLGISQEELASRAGIHRTYLGGVERGERNVGLLNILRISEALEVRPEELLKGVQILKKKS
jgi:transcriptional regulator with XRE-family HTH domain